MRLERFYDSPFATHSNTTVLELVTESLVAPSPPNTRFAPVLSAAHTHTNAHGGHRLRGWRRARPQGRTKRSRAGRRAPAREGRGPRRYPHAPRCAAAARGGECAPGIPRLGARRSRLRVRPRVLHWFCTRPALEQLALARMKGSIAWELLSRMFFREVRFETKAALTGDRAHTEEMEKKWNHTFEFTDHVSDIAAVCAARTVRGLEPFIEMRRDREIPPPPAPNWGTQAFEDWLRGPYSPRYTEEPWTAECTL
ncbi:hypothetical protein PsYK624_148490 [Phanerochaete sordida]|uniref:Uncharacterized protein n=1 Tax=Phanerochaete sordida TaxID=48140 RepID=A0A9P3GNB6_9APHY|nr:hypothetical protein PsYK624_148490 [Phanerochaete sordida]